MFLATLRVARNRGADFVRGQSERAVPGLRKEKTAGVFIKRNMSIIRELAD